MPVRKFRSVEELPAPPTLPACAAETLRAAFELSALATRLRPLRFAPGVRRFRSMEEKNRWQEDEVARAIRAARGG